MYTKNAGTTWSTVKTPGLKAVYDLVFTDSTTGYAVGDSGVVLKYSPEVTEVQENQPLTPAELRLLQNYPNPFNPATQIDYGIPVQSYVRLTIYNSLGQEVARLVDQEQAAGSYAAPWNATAISGASVASGMYFYKLEATSVKGRTFSETRKLVLLR